MDLYHTHLPINKDFSAVCPDPLFLQLPDNFISNKVHLYLKQWLKKYFFKQQSI